jgi:xylose isomerase
MKRWKYCANAGFFGARRDRFNQYQPDRTLEEKIALVSQVEGITGIELKYPGDLDDSMMVKNLLDQYELQLSVVNVNTKAVSHFRYGSLTARSEETRRTAVQLLKEGMDIAAEMGVGLVSNCPVMDGYDYPFQVDYAQAWNDFIAGCREVTAHRPDVTLMLEFQPHDPNAKILLNNVGKVLYVCAEVDAQNIGANLDVGHSLAAGEAPAESAALLSRNGLLKYVHSNDNTGDGGDWDMISGSVHFWHWVEFIFTLIREGYEGWIGADLAPRHFGPVAAYQTNIMMIDRMTNLIERVGIDQIQTLLGQDGNTPGIYEKLTADLA